MIRCADQSDVDAVNVSYKRAWKFATVARLNAKPGNVGPPQSVGTFRKTGGSKVEGVIICSRDCVHPKILKTSDSGRGSLKETAQAACRLVVRRKHSFEVYDSEVRVAEYALHCLKYAFR
jgi:hypothetical protein